MPYDLRLMHKGDIAQVAEIDREAFPTQLPPANYQRDLQNKLARYFVACDQNKTVEASEIRTRPEKGLYKLTSGIMRWFNRNHSSGDELPQSGSQYIVGFAGIWFMADEAHIINIAARKRYQRRGIGELLLMSIIALATELDARIVTLEVRASNTTAQNLYYKYGFTQAGLRRGYYTDNNEDGIVMSTENITSTPFQARLQQLKEAHSSKWGIANRQLARNYPAQPDKQ